MGVGVLKSENPGVPGGGGFTILKTPGTPGVGDWDYRGVSQTLAGDDSARLLKSREIKTKISYSLSFRTNYNRRPDV